MMVEGWIKLHRKILDHPMWLSEPFTRSQAWIDLVLLANHKPKMIRVRGIPVTIQRGQVGWSERALGERWRWSRGKVRRFLKELKTVQQIEQQKNNVTNCISIVNYDKYQVDGTQDGTTDGQQTDTKRYQNKNEKNDKKSWGDENPLDRIPEKERHPAAQKRLEELALGMHPPDEFSPPRSDTEIFQMVLSKIKDDPGWWDGLKHYCKMHTMSPDVVENSVKKWASYVFRKTPGETRRWATMEASLKNWFLREEKPKVQQL